MSTPLLNTASTSNTSATAAGAVHRLGPVDQVPVGEGRAFAVDGRQIAVFRLRSGAVHAVQARCPHKGGPLADGQIDGSIVLCPLHMNAYELATGCSTTGQPALARYTVAVEDGELVLTVPA